MDNNLFGNWQDYSKSALASAKELEVINTEIVEKLTSKQMELANTTFESGTRYVATLSEVKDYQDMIAQQTKIVAEFNETLIESARTSADILTGAREAYQNWLEQSLKTMTANADFNIPGFSPVAKKSTRKAA